MSDTSFDDGEYKVIYVEAVIHIDGKEIHLPTDVEEGYPRLVKFDEKLKTHVADFPLPDGLSPVDVVITALYKWKPLALLKFLDTSNTSKFLWQRVKDRPYWRVPYIKRDANFVVFGVKENRAHARPEYEVTFRIDQSGKWRLSGQSHFGKQIGTNTDDFDYTAMFAEAILGDKVWKKRETAQCKLFYKDNDKDDENHANDDDEEPYDTEEDDD